MYRVEASDKHVDGHKHVDFDGHKHVDFVGASDKQVDRSASVEASDKHVDFDGRKHVDSDGSLLDLGSDKQVDRSKENLY